MFRLHNKGFTLIELVIIIIILGVISTVAIRKMSGSIDAAVYEHTKKELDQLAYAIAGNPNVYTNGSRTDFGYVGDVGSLPADLSALAVNPGSYSTWDGPYITNGTSVSDYSKDGWNTSYILNGVTLSSTGSGSNIDKQIAGSAGDLLSNSVEGFIVDATNQPPGSVYNDSLRITLAYPNGSGGMNSSVIYPDKNGYFTYTGIPIGVHTLTVTFLPEGLNQNYPVTVTPGSQVKLDIVFASDLW